MLEFEVLKKMTFEEYTLPFTDFYLVLFCSVCSREADMQLHVEGKKLGS
jgi:hypothetical protein